MRPVPELLIPFLFKVEACRLTAYQDSVGVWTIGVGHTGLEVHGGLRITQAKATEYLRADLQIAAGRLYRVVKAEAIAALTDHQYAAILSFVFNLGVGKWKIWDAINAGKLDQVPAQMMRFVNAGGKQLPGLVNRRTKEVALWSQADDHPVIAAAPSSEIRAQSTPPTPEAGKPLAQSKTFWSGAAVTAAGAVQGAQQVQALIAPQMSNSEYLGKIASVVAVVVVGLGVAIMVFRWLDNRSKRA